MGIERVSRSAKLDLENDLWIEGIRTNVFPWLTRSAAINEVLSCIRRSFEEHDLPATKRFWQGMARLYCVQGVQGIRIPEPAPGPKSVTTAKRKEKSA